MLTSDVTHLHLRRWPSRVSTARSRYKWVTSLVSMCNVPRFYPYVCGCIYIYRICVTIILENWHSCSEQPQFGTAAVHICDMSHSYIWHESFIAHRGDQTCNIWISRSVSFPIDLLSHEDSVYPRENSFENLGTLVKTCLQCTGTHVKTCCNFGF